jgi:hypothetical protein
MHSSRLRKWLVVIKTKEKLFGCLLYGGAGFHSSIIMLKRPMHGLLQICHWSKWVTYQKLVRCVHKVKSSPSVALFVALFVWLIQQYFTLRTNKPPATSQQYFPLRTNQHPPPAKRTGCVVIHLIFFCLDPCTEEMDPSGPSTIAADPKGEAAPLPASRLPFPQH